MEDLKTEICKPCSGNCRNSPTLYYRLLGYSVRWAPGLSVPHIAVISDCLSASTTRRVSRRTLFSISRLHVLQLRALDQSGIGQNPRPNPRPISVVIHVDFSRPQHTEWLRPIHPHLISISRPLLAQSYQTRVQ